MDDDVVQMFHQVNERIKRLEAALKAEVDEREGLGGQYQVTDGEVTAINRSLGAWVRGNISDKLDDLQKGVNDADKRLDALEKKMKK